MRSAVRLVAAGREESRGGRVRFDDGAKRAAVEHAERVMQRGGSLKEASRDLSVAYETLRRWRQPRSLPLVRAVQVADAHDVSRLVVVLPGGARVEGLDVAGVAELARRLS